MRVLWARSGAIVVTVLLAAVLAVPAAAAHGLAWRIPRLLPVGMRSFEDVSCATANDCVVIGPRRIERWNGVSWSGQSPIAKFGGTAVSCLATWCQAVGDLPERAERITGRTLTPEPIQTPPAETYGAALLSVTCASERTCLAAGWAFTNTLVDCNPNPYTYGCQTQSPLIERLRGKAWRVQKLPLPVTITPDLPNGGTGPGAALYGVSCAGAKACLAVGDWWRTPGGLTHALVERWDGSRWSLLTPAASTAAAFGGVSCVSPQHCVAVGSKAMGPRVKPLVEVWNGRRRWRVLSAPDPSGSQDTVLASVSCVGTTCVAVGRAGAQPLIERGSGRRWVRQSAPRPPDNHARGGSSLQAVSCGAVDSCVAVGTYDNGDSFVEQYPS